MDLLAVIPTYFQDIQVIIGAILAIGGFIVSFKKWVLKPIFKFWNDVKQTLINIEYISKQIKPNGGSSILDKLQRIERRQIISDYRYSIILNNIDIAMYETDHTGACLWVSEEWTKYTGLHLEHARGNGWINAVYYEDRDKVFEEWKDSLDQKREFRLKYRIMHVDTQQVTEVIGYSCFIYDHSGNPIATVGFIKKV